MRRVDALDAATDLLRLTSQLDTAARRQGLALTTVDIAAAASALKIQAAAVDSPPHRRTQIVKEALILGHCLANRVKVARARLN